MSSVEIRPDALIEKDPNDSRIVLFNWDEENLAAAVTISSSTWVITCELPVGESPVALTNDNSSIVATANRKTQTRLVAGTLGSLYRVTNRIVTSESPTQTKERSVFVQVVDR